MGRLAKKGTDFDLANYIYNLKHKVLNWRGTAEELELVRFV